MKKLILVVMIIIMTAILIQLSLSIRMIMTMTPILGGLGFIVLNLVKLVKLIT